MRRGREERPSKGRIRKVERKPRERGDSEAKGAEGFIKKKKLLAQRIQGTFSFQNL